MGVTISQYTSAISIQPFLTDPLHWKKGLCSQSLYMDATQAASTAGFWGSFAQLGDFLAMTAGAERTVLSVSGRGKLYGVIGANNCGTFDLTVAIDGVDYTFPQVTPGVNNRPVYNLTGISTADRFTHATDGASEMLYIHGQTGRTADDAYLVIPQQTTKTQINHPLLWRDLVKFDTSLEVRATVGSTPAAYVQNCGVIWNFDD